LAVLMDSRQAFATDEQNSVEGRGKPSGSPVEGLCEYLPPELQAALSAAIFCPEV
jgi:hypothetical protein